VPRTIELLLRLTSCTHIGVHGFSGVQSGRSYLFLRVGANVWGFCLGLSSEYTHPQCRQATPGGFAVRAATPTDRQSLNGRKPFPIPCLFNGYLLVMAVRVCLSTKMGCE